MSDLERDFAVSVVERFRPPATHYAPPDEDFLASIGQSVLWHDGQDTYHWSRFVPETFANRWGSLVMETKYAIYWMACEAANLQKEIGWE